MFRSISFAGSIAAVCVGLIAVSVVPAVAEDFFIPGQQRPAQSASQPPQQAAPRPAPAPRPSPSPAAPPSFSGGPIGPGGDQDQAAPVQVALPPMPELPPIAKGNPPPSAVIGVIGVPEVMRASNAAQAVDKVIGSRRDKLNEDAQKEQAAWREMQQTLAAQSSTMSPEQKRGRERELQDRIANAQKAFRDRARIIQEAAQYGVGQIERALVAVIRQVADSHDMNLVLHRSQVALNVSSFDITDEVTLQLNKVLPSVVIPPDGVSVVDLPPQPGTVTTPTNAAATGAAGAAPLGPRR